MTTKLLNREPALENIRQHGFFDDFFSYTDAQLWTLAAGTGTGTAAVIAPGDAVNGSGGILRITTGATDNDEEYLYTTNELWKVANDKPIMAIARLRLTQSGANRSAFVFGLVDAPADNLIVSDEGGLATGKHGALFYKPSASAVLTPRNTAVTAAGNFANNDATERSTGT